MLKVSTISSNLSAQHMTRALSLLTSSSTVTLLSKGDLGITPKTSISSDFYGRFRSAVIDHLVWYFVLLRLLNPPA